MPGMDQTLKIPRPHVRAAPIARARARPQRGSLVFTTNGAAAATAAGPRRRGRRRLRRLRRQRREPPRGARARQRRRSHRDAFPFEPPATHTDTWRYTLPRARRALQRRRISRRRAAPPSHRDTHTHIELSVSGAQCRKIGWPGRALERPNGPLRTVVARGVANWKWVRTWREPEVLRPDNPGRAVCVRRGRTPHVFSSLATASCLSLFLSFSSTSVD